VLFLLFSHITPQPVDTRKRVCCLRRVGSRGKHGRNIAYLGTTYKVDLEKLPELPKLPKIAESDRSLIGFWQFRRFWQFTSLVPQRHKGIDSRGATSRNVAGGQRDHGEQASDGGQRNGIAAADLVEQTLQET